MLWAAKFNLSIPEVLVALQMRMTDRPKVRSAIDYEEMLVKRVGSM